MQRGLIHGVHQSFWSYVYVQLAQDSPSSFGVMIVVHDAETAGAILHTTTIIKLHACMTSKGNVSQCIISWLTNYDGCYYITNTAIIWLFVIDRQKTSSILILGLWLSYLVLTIFYTLQCSNGNTAWVLTNVIMYSNVWVLRFYTCTITYFLHELSLHIIDL